MRKEEIPDSYEEEQRFSSGDSTRVVVEVLIEEGFDRSLYSVGSLESSQPQLPAGTASRITLLHNDEAQIPDSQEVLEVSTLLTSEPGSARTYARSPRIESSPSARLPGNFSGKKDIVQTLPSLSVVDQPVLQAPFPTKNLGAPEPQSYRKRAKYLEENEEPRDASLGPHTTDTGPRLETEESWFTTNPLLLSSVKDSAHSLCGNETHQDHPPRPAAQSSEVAFTVNASSPASSEGSETQSQNVSNYDPIEEPPVIPVQVGVGDTQQHQGTASWSVVDDPFALLSQSLSRSQRAVDSIEDLPFHTQVPFGSQSSVEEIDIAGSACVDQRLVSPSVLVFL